MCLFIFLLLCSLLLHHQRCASKIIGHFSTAEKWKAPPFFIFRHCEHPLCGQTSYLTSTLSPTNNVCVCGCVCVCVWKEPKAIIIASSRARFNRLLPLYVFSCCVFLAVFLRSHKSLESVDPQFTMRRKMEQLREELELMEQLREVEHRQFNVQWLVIKGKLQLAVTLRVVCTVSLTGCLAQWLNPFD